jgi:iron-sulfur cluster repair protein YtfE (RIC family)
MNASTSSHDTFEKMHQEHDALREKLGQIHDLFTGVNPSHIEIIALLQEFEEALALHFSNEEVGGYFADVTSRSPELAEHVGRLAREHQELRQSAAELRRFALAGSPSMPWWRELASRCHAFSQHLMHHESEENRLLQQAYRQDVGVID